MNWIRLAEPPADEDAYVSALAMSDVLLALVKSSFVDIKEWHAALDFNKRRAAEDLFKPIQMSIRGGSAWARCLCLNLEIHRTICTRTPAFYGSLPTNTVISNICENILFRRVQKTHNTKCEGMISLLIQDGSILSFFQVVCPESTTRTPESR